MGVANLETGMHHLVLGARRQVHAGGVGVGVFLEAHQHLDLSAKRALVEFDRLLGAAVEEQVGLNLHDSLLSQLSMAL